MIVIDVLTHTDAIQQQLPHHKNTVRAARSAAVSRDISAHMASLIQTGPAERNCFCIFIGQPDANSEQGAIHHFCATDHAVPYRRLRGGLVRG
jgi:hypothetical protein